jgi:hypothetical protein
MNEPAQTPPKVFLSYSWSNPEHEQWVIQLATELRETGVDVIFDKWDLREGHDAYVFMEQMVTNAEIQKVIILCDKVYSAKADGRMGGVGTETQIISKEVYDHESQDKFVAVVCERDEGGKACLPTYYKSRIYIDLSDPGAYTENVERLLRWIFNKPLYVKPPIGKSPSFISDGDHLDLGTTAYSKRCIDAIKNQKAFAAGALDEYLGTFEENLERFRITEFENLDEDIIKNIANFLPYRNEMIQIFISAAQYSADSQTIIRLHRFLERLVPYLKRPETVTRWHEHGADNFKFIIHELFLYLIAILLKHERMGAVNYLLSRRYFVPEHYRRGDAAMVSYVVFREYMPSLDHRNKRLGLRRLSLRADFLKERCSGSGIDFRYLLQADFVVFQYAEINFQNIYERWWPETLVYLERFHSAFEIFARSASKSYFDQAKVVLGIDQPSDIEELLKSYRDGSRELPRWQHSSFSPATLLGYESLASLP